MCTRTHACSHTHVHTHTHSHKVLSLMVGLAQLTPPSLDSGCHHQEGCPGP